MLKTLSNRYSDLLSTSSLSRRRLLLQIVIIFIVAFVVRTTAWYYWQTEALTVQTTVAENYKVLARLLVSEGPSGFFRSSSAMSSPDLLGHPPGYSLLLALVYKTAGESDRVVQCLQILADALAAVMIFLIASELLHSTIAFLAGLLAALSPQFAWNSILLLPDTLAIVPLLLAIYLFARWRNKTRLANWFVIGVLIGLSCLVRPNALLFAPFLGVWLLLCERKLERKNRLTAAMVLVLGTVCVIAPFTIRNAIVFGRFVPLSIGAGQTLLEGIADYDPGRRFGFPDTDTEIARMEAERFKRPDYAETLFGPDGIERERFRMREGASVITSNPIWFASVMVRRAASMLRLERVPLISASASAANGYPSPFRAVQSVFKTVVVLPLTLLGVGILVAARRWAVLVVLLVIPAYYFCVQSALHTEYRYILALNHFQFVFAAVAVCFILVTVPGWAKRGYE